MSCARTSTSRANRWSGAYAGARSAAPILPAILRDDEAAARKVE